MAGLRCDLARFAIQPRAGSGARQEGLGVHGYRAGGELLERVHRAVGVRDPEPEILAEALGVMSEHSAPHQCLTVTPGARRERLGGTVQEGRRRGGALPAHDEGQGGGLHPLRVLRMWVHCLQNAHLSSGLTGRGAGKATPRLTERRQSSDPRRPAIIVGCAILPVPKTTALGPVATGNMNAQLAARATPIAGATGDTPSAWAAAITSGTRIFADAVFEQVSVKKTVKSVATAVSTHTLRTPVAARNDSPRTPASPVSTIWVPNAMPPPKSKMSPQSIRAASDQGSTSGGALDMPGSDSGG